MPVTILAEQITSVKVALPPGFLGSLGELPIVEARPEALSNRLMFLGPLIMAETVVGKFQGFGPSVTRSSTEAPWRKDLDKLM